MSKWKKQKGGYSVILNYLSVDEQVSAADVTLKCVYSYLFMSVHLVIELLRLVVNLGGCLPACSTTSYQRRRRSRSSDFQLLANS